MDFHNFLFPKTIRYEISDSRNIQGFALIYKQSFSHLKHDVCQKNARNK